RLALHFSKTGTHSSLTRQRRSRLMQQMDQTQELIELFSDWFEKEKQIRERSPLKRSPEPPLAPHRPRRSRKAPRRGITPCAASPLAPESLPSPPETLLPRDILQPWGKPTPSRIRPGSLGG